MLKISRQLYDSLRQHGEETYPDECCGVLVGQIDDNTRLVTSIARAGNTRTDSAHNRYNIDPKELIKIQSEGRKRGEDIVGFYHSHPDHPAVPSEYDREHGLPFFHYVVLAVGPESPGEIASYVLSEDRGVFEREELLIDSNGK
jgi:proteasome lid subunit RPN8/RPN11